MSRMSPFHSSTHNGWATLRNELQKLRRKAQRIPAPEPEQGFDPPSSFVLEFSEGYYYQPQLTPWAERNINMVRLLETCDGIAKRNKALLGFRWRDSPYGRWRELVSIERDGPSLRLEGYERAQYFGTPAGGLPSLLCLPLAAFGRMTPSPQNEETT